MEECTIKNMSTCNVGCESLGSKGHASARRRLLHVHFGQSIVRREDQRKILREGSI